MMKELVPQGKALGSLFLEMAADPCFTESSWAAV